MDNSIRKLLQDIAYTAGVAADEAKNAAKSVKKAVCEKADSAKANMAILALRADMEEIFAEIGRILYLMNSGSFETADENGEHNPNEEINTLLVKASEKQAEIDAMTDKLNSLKGENECPGCNKKCKSSDVFCCICGTRLKPVQPEISVDEVANVVADVPSVADTFDVVADYDDQPQE